MNPNPDFTITMLMNPNPDFMIIMALNPNPDFTIIMALNPNPDCKITTLTLDALFLHTYIGCVTSKVLRFLSCRQSNHCAENSQSRSRLTHCRECEISLAGWLSFTPSVVFCPAWKLSERGIEKRGTLTVLRTERLIHTLPLIITSAEWAWMDGWVMWREGRVLPLPWNDDN